MSVNIKEYLINRIRELYAGSAMTPDLKPGSAFYDLLVLPLATLLEDYQTEHEEILNLQKVTDPAALVDVDLDAIAMNFLLARNAGTRCSGYIKMYYSRPVTLSIPKETTFVSADGLEYQTVSDIYVSKIQMEANISEFPYYDSGEIPIISVDAGDEYNKPVNTLFTIEGSINIPTPSKIVNTEAFTEGTEKEGNQAFFDRIQASVYNKSLASKEAIDSKIKELYPTVVKTEVIGAGSPLMIRDLSSLEGSSANYVEEDFYLTYSGRHSGIYDSPHIAMVGLFDDVDESSNVLLPAKTSWSKEFSDAMYQGVYNLYDMDYAFYDEEVILREDFGDTMRLAGVQPSLALVLASGFWQVHDGMNPNQELFYLNEIEIRGDKLVLGHHIDATDPDRSMQVNLSTITGLMNLIGSYLKGTTEEAYAQLAELASAYNYNNTAPIIHKQIDQHLGIYIDLTMQTTDDTELGEMCYITVLRNTEVFLPQDGYGLAWRKQPEWLIRIDLGTATTDDYDTFEEHYGVDARDLDLVGNLHKVANKQYWKYNVYLVDNDVLQEEVWVGHDQMWDQTSGRNQFLVAGKAWIEKDREYNIRIKIYETLGVEAWVFDETRPDTWNSSSEEDKYEEINRIIYRGATYPTFVPVSGAKLVRTNGVEVIEAKYDHFGIAVAQTRNNEWTVDNLVIRSFIQTFPMHLFRFKINESDWDITKEMTVTYYGVGYDFYQYFNDDETGHSSVKCAIYCPENDEAGITNGWIDLGSHTNTIKDGLIDIDSLKITDTVTTLSDYIDEDGYVNIAATATNSGPVPFNNDVTHSLRSYYIKIDNGSTSMVHRGNAADVYVFDPINLKSATTVVTVTNNKINTNSTSFRGYIADIIEVREYITKVAFDREAYTIVNTNEGTSYTGSASYDIVFDEDDMSDTMVEVEYLYWAQGDLVNHLLTLSEYRYPAADIVVKVMPLFIVNIEQLNYSGGLRADQMKTKLIEYFNTLTVRSFDKSDLVNVLYDNGATYVDLNIVINIRSYNTVFDYSFETMSGQTYLIPYSTVGAFYTRENELSGVIQNV